MIDFTNKIEINNHQFDYLKNIKELVTVYVNIKDNTRWVTNEDYETYLTKDDVNINE